MMCVVYFYCFLKMGYLYSFVIYNGYDSMVIYYIGFYLEGFVINIWNYFLFGNCLFWVLFEDK